MRDSVFRSCVFQLSAILEDYFSEVISTWLNSLQGQRSELLPLYTRAIYTARIQERIFKSYLSQSDERAVVEAISDLRSSFKILEDREVIDATNLSAVIVKDRKFPSVANIETICKRIGCPVMLDYVSRRTRSDVRLSLRSFIDVRNALAHEGPPSITDLDVARYFEQVTSWIDAIDRELHRHVCSVSGRGHWPA